MSLVKDKNTKRQKVVSSVLSIFLSNVSLVLSSVLSVLYHASIVTLAFGKQKSHKVTVAAVVSVSDGLDKPWQ